MEMNRLLTLLRPSWEGAGLLAPTAIRALSQPGRIDDLSRASAICPSNLPVLNVHFVPKANHWVVIHARPGESLRILDSMPGIHYGEQFYKEAGLVYQEWGTEERGIRAQVFHPARQHDATSCGVFSGAWLIDLVLGYEPTKRTYPPAAQLREKLKAILDSGNLEVIPILPFANCLTSIVRYSGVLQWRLCH